MKDKILMLIIGILIGAIITTLVFFGYINSKAQSMENNMENFRNMEGKERPNVGNMIERPEDDFPRGEMPKEPTM